MHPEIKRRPATGKRSGLAVKPLQLHEVANPAASARAASRHRLTAIQPASGGANHARHHVSRQTQS